MTTDYRKSNHRRSEKSISKPTKEHEHECKISIQNPAYIFLAAHATEIATIVIEPVISGISELTKTGGGGGGGGGEEGRRGERSVARRYVRHNLGRRISVAHKVSTSEPRRKRRVAIHTLENSQRIPADTLIRRKKRWRMKRRRKVEGIPAFIASSFSST